MVYSALAVCPPVRLQCLVEIRPGSVAEAADAAIWLLDRAGHASREIGGQHVTDAERYELSWSAGGLSGPSGPVSDELARFEFGLRRWPRMSGRLSWCVPIQPDGGLKVAVAAHSHESHTDLEVEMLWFSSDDASTVALVETALTGLARDAAAELSPGFLHLTDDNSFGSTALDTLQRRQATYLTSVPGDLRSYSWTTYVDMTQAAQLGGRDQLIASGAFFVVEPAGGGLLLQATQHLADYVGEHVRAVKLVLSPLLPDLPERSHIAGARLAYDDGTAGPFEPPPGNWIAASPRASARGRTGAANARP